MSKANKTIPVDYKYCRSTFTLTFAIEVTYLDELEDREGWLEQGPCTQGVKLQCTLYPGQVFDLDVMIWPQTAKIWCGPHYSWVRTWRFLQKRWLAFSIRFAFPVRVVDLCKSVATVVALNGVGFLGNYAKNDKNSNVYLPPLSFGVKRHFAPVLEHEDESLTEFMRKILWELVEHYIPWSCFDGQFEVPSIVTDSRHQDAIIDHIRDLILNRSEKQGIPEPSELEVTDDKGKNSKIRKSKEKIRKKSTDASKNKTELKLSGQSILAGTGRIVSFKKTQAESPEIIVLISSNNLPARDDLPTVFLNVRNLCQIPLNELKELRTTHLYVKWQIGEEVNISEPQLLKSDSTIDLDDHKALPVTCELLPKITAEFLDSVFQIELHGIRLPAPKIMPQLFGDDKTDRGFGKCVPKLINEDLDFLIAITRIDAKQLSKGPNTFLSGEFPLYPPYVTAKPLDREAFGTNDINLIRRPICPELVVRPEIILKAQMTLEVSMGVVGCTPRNHTEFYSRLFCLIGESCDITSLLHFISNSNTDAFLSGTKDNVLSGFALDTGNIVVLYVEGPRNGHILRLKEMAEDVMPKLKMLFSSSDKYSSRIYEELTSSLVPFISLKMYTPLEVILACPPVYVRPTLPLPTRAALLKISRLVASDCSSFPTRCQMPTTLELKSFKLELCATWSVSDDEHFD